MKKKFIKTIKETVSLALVITVAVMLMYEFSEPQLVKAGSGPYEDQILVTQSVTAEISITSPSDVAMSPSIPGMTGSGGTPSTGSATWTIITNNNTGFNLTLKASSSPAMGGNGFGDSFANYTPSTPNVPDYTWSIAAAAAEFGYSVEPATAADTSAIFRDNGSACNTGSGNTVNRCWLNASTSAVTVINRSSQTTSSGEAEVVKFQVEQGASTFKIEDTYTATTTVTATMN